MITMRLALNRLWRARWLRNSVIGGLSVLVLGGLAAYATLTPAESVYAATSVSWTSGSAEHVHGWVKTSSGQPVTGAVVEVFRYKPDGGTILYGVDRTGPRGRYSIWLHLPKRRYWIHIHKAPCCGSGYHDVAALRRELAPGMRLDINARIVHGSRLFFLPIFNY